MSARNHSVIYNFQGKRFYGVKKRGEGFEMIEEPEDRVLMTKDEATALFNKIVNRNQFRGVQVVRVL